MPGGAGLLPFLLAPLFAAGAAEQAPPPAPAAERTWLSIGGRIEVEASASSPHPETALLFPFEDGIGLRRTRGLLLGQLRGKFELKVEYDFTAGDLIATDVYAGVLPAGVTPGVRLGHMKEPFSLSVLTSANFVAFIERPASVTSLAPFRNAGILVHGLAAGDRIGWAVGAFRDSEGFDLHDGSEWSLSGRLTGLALDPAREGDPLLHLGAGASRRRPTPGSARFRGRTAAQLAPRFVDTGHLPSNTVSLWGIEAAMSRGALWFQAESLHAQVDLLDGRGQARLAGYYVEAGWFLTGETRPYHRTFRTFGRLSPSAPFPTGTGAWEVALRWDDVDLADGTVAGGSKRSVTIGLNWHLRSDLRTLLNYVSTKPAGTGSVDFIGLLLHVDF